MTDIMNQAMGAYPGLTWLTAAIIAIVCALLTSRLPQVFLWSVIATIILTFWKVVSDAVTERSISGVGGSAMDVVKNVQTDWLPVIVHFVIFLIVIAVLFLLKSAFRRA